MSATVELRAGPLRATLGSVGATIRRFEACLGDGVIPLLRQAAGEGDDPLRSGGFPLLPFGNRVRDNRFAYEGREYRFIANQAWDPTYLHGDGWLARWTVAAQDSSSARFALSHCSDNGPYTYDAAMTATLAPDALTLTLSVTNAGPVALPFGLGWHPYMPLTPRTTLQARATRMWTEGPGFLPGAPEPPPADLRFEAGTELPRRWINNGFEGWDGRAVICWPERAAGLRIETTPPFTNYWLFMSDPTFEPDFAADYFCFEPMSHRACAHEVADGGFVRLDAGATLSASLRLGVVALRG